MRVRVRASHRKREARGPRHAKVAHCALADALALLDDARAVRLLGAKGESDERNRDLAERVGVPGVRERLVQPVGDEVLVRVRG